MRKVLFFIPLLMFMSCKSKEEKAIDKYFEDNLKDPKSFVIYSLEEYKDKAKLDEKTYILDYGAKNGFGAMDRQTVLIEFDGDKIIAVDTKEEYDKRKDEQIWNDINKAMDEAGLIPE